MMLHLGILQETWRCVKAIRERLLKIEGRKLRFGKYLIRLARGRRRSVNAWGFRLHVCTWTSSELQLETSSPEPANYYMTLHCMLCQIWIEIPDFIIQLTFENARSSPLAPKRPSPFFIFTTPRLSFLCFFLLVETDDMIVSCHGKFHTRIFEQEDASGFTISASAAPLPRHLHLSSLPSCLLCGD